MKKEDTILVTGASGYLATSIIKHLLKDDYQVRGTVRSLENEDKIKHLKELTPNATQNLQLVEADLLKEETWKEAVKDCKYVIHVASPFPNSIPNHPDDIIKPAVEGTLTVLRACSEAGCVKRLVLTSSALAVYDSSLPLPKENEETKTFTEEHWSNIEDPNHDIYGKSKVLAEKAAWDFVEKLSADKKFELAVINPGLILGPLYSKVIPTSVDIVKRLLERATPAIPKLSLPVTDVRDVALAHIKALFVPEAAGHRHLIVSSSVWMKEVALALQKEFKPQGYHVPTLIAPNFMVWLSCFVDKTYKLVLPRLSRDSKYDNKRMVQVLGVTPTDYQKTVIDTAYSLIELGVVKKPKKQKKSKEEEKSEENEAKTNGA